MKITGVRYARGGQQRVLAHRATITVEELAARRQAQADTIEAAFAGRDWRNAYFQGLVLPDYQQEQQQEGGYTAEQRDKK